MASDFLWKTILTTGFWSWTSMSWTSFLKYISLCLSSVSNWNHQSVNQSVILLRFGWLEALRPLSACLLFHRQLSTAPSHPTWPSPKPPRNLASGPTAEPTQSMAWDLPPNSSFIRWACSAWSHRSWFAFCCFFIPDICPKNVKEQTWNARNGQKILGSELFSNRQGNPSAASCELTARVFRHLTT